MTAIPLPTSIAPAAAAPAAAASTAVASTPATSPTATPARAASHGAQGDDAQAAAFSAALERRTQGAERPSPRFANTAAPGKQAVDASEAAAKRADGSEDESVLANQAADLAQQVWAWATPALQSHTTAESQTGAAQASGPQAGGIAANGLAHASAALAGDMRSIAAQGAARVLDAEATTLGLGEASWSARGTPGAGSRHEGVQTTQSRSARAARPTEILPHQVSARGDEPLARAAAENTTIQRVAAAGAGEHATDAQPQGHARSSDSFASAISTAAAHLDSALSVMAPRATEALGRAAQVHAPLGHPSWAQDVMSHVVNWSRSGADGVMKAELFLTPSELGPLRVAITLNDGVASAAFVSAHAPVRQALEQALPHLQAALAQSGISLAQTHVGDQGSGAGFQDQGSRDGQSAHGMQGTLTGGSSTAPAPTPPAPARPGPHLLDVFA